MKKCIYATTDSMRAFLVEAGAVELSSHIGDGVSIWMFDATSLKMEIPGTYDGQYVIEDSFKMTF